MGGGTPVEFVATKFNRANMAAGTMMTGYSQHQLLEELNTPPKPLKIAERVAGAWACA
jgi:hypothetical protein